MSRRMWVLAVAAWLGVVVAGSALTWIAIDRAGHQVTSSPKSTETTQPPLVGTVGTAPTTAPPLSSTPSPTATPAPVTTGPAPTQPATTKRPTTSPPKTPSPPTTRTETRTWSGGPGSLTVSCTGTRVAFKNASPSDGWTFERGDDSGDDVEGKFRSGESEVQVRATCVGGAPQFRVESGSSDDG